MVAAKNGQKYDFTDKTYVPSSCQKKNLRTLYTRTVFCCNAQCGRRNIVQFLFFHVPRVSYLYRDLQLKTIQIYNSVSYSIVPTNARKKNWGGRRFEKIYHYLWIAVKCKLTFYLSKLIVFLIKFH